MRWKELGAVFIQWLQTTVVDDNCARTHGDTYIVLALGSYTTQARDAVLHV